MIIKKLTNEIQSLLNASSKIKSYKTAVEELVYNSLDANATSVAVRIHVYENIIQVIDNGSGIAKCDITLLGQRYASSKVTDKSSLKSAPNTFGFRGESLSNIVEVSQCLKITTRHKDTNETWVKIFCEGQHKDSQITAMRPSKGTTVEVKGFLYNLFIQKRATNPLKELENIKLFLQQLSLVNTNVSLSLRDNSKNEIIFKVHKNRDVYQTLSSLYEIDRKDVQELQIEKHQYKAKGYIEKQNCKINSYQWIYLNGRFINKCHLHDMINSNFTKNKQLCRNVKNKNSFLDFEKKIHNIEIPSYFIFITCPHLDYDINISTKIIIEFKDWTQIRELLEKLVQFYKGDVKLKKLDAAETEKKNKIESTREEVRKIMEKVLGNKNKGQNISQLRKGVKGKIVKKKKILNSSIKKQFKNIGKKSKESTHNPSVPIENMSLIIEAPISNNFLVPGCKDDQINNHNVKRSNKNKKEKRKNMSKLKIESIQQDVKSKAVNTYTNNLEFEDQVYLSNSKENMYPLIENTTKDYNLHVKNKKTLIKDKSFKRRKEKQKTSVQKIDPNMKQFMQETALEMYGNKLKKKESKLNEVQANNPYIFDTKVDTAFLQSGNNIHTFYEHKLAFNGVTPLNRIEKDCLKSSDLLNTILNSQKVYSKENSFQFKKPFKIHHQESKQSSERRKNYDVLNDIDNINIDQLPNIDYNSYIRKQTDNLRNVQEIFKKKYDDIERTMANIQNECEMTSNLDQDYGYNKRITDVNNMETNISTTHIYKSFPKLTFESHKYNINDVMLMKSNKTKRFISEQSKENFDENQCTYVTSNKYKSYFNQHNNKRKQPNKYSYTRPVNTPYFKQKSSRTIEFSTTNNIYNGNHNTTLDQWKYKITGNIQNTYTILDSNVSLNITNYLNNLNKNTINQESVASYLRFNLSSRNGLIEKERHKDPNEQNLEENNLEIILHSEALPFSQKTDQIDPIDLCEAVYQNQHHNKIDNFNMNKEPNKSNANLTTRNEKYVIDDSSSYKNYDMISRYFETIENIQNWSLNDYQNLSNKDQSKDKGINQTYNNDPAVDNANKSPNVFNEEISHHFQVQNDEIMQKSKNLFSSEEYKVIKESKEQRNVENQSNGDSNLVQKITRIENESNVIENNDVIIEDQNMVMKNLNNSDINKNSKDDEIIKSIGDNQNKSKDVEIVKATDEKNLNNHETLKKTENFILQSRHNFVPKGMSPIFQNCNNKNICSYNLDKDYFQDDLYNNFANDILNNIKIYENKVSNINEIYKKDNKDSNCLKFDTESLKNAKVFGQIDRKFIVAELKSENLNMKHLVLFDQHAVHERIKLEENLTDYKTGDQWNSINCESLSLKLSKDDVLYLNNFRDKFKQFGLDWKIENDSLITINAVPKAIFGKYCRQADVIIQSIKNLIIEEIKAIKTLGGSTLSYPKSIMDLVFSEACRYAIKFGDRLSKSECATLISSLSSCKTPFQCAHGRPVLAVLSDLSTYDNDYKVDTSKILRFRNKLT